MSLALNTSLVDNSQSVAGDNSMREFEGEFSSYGFFEKEAKVYRGSAGANTAEKMVKILNRECMGFFIRGN